MSFFASPPKPRTSLGWHCALSPTAAVKVSPICLGGISIGQSWSELFGKNEDPFTLLDSFYSLGGNFIDTSSIYNSEESETLIGKWMDERGVRDQMVVATKYSSCYKSYDRGSIPIQTNYIGNSAKNMHLSVRDSLKKLRTDYIDVLYVHWWDFATSVEEVMTHLHALVLARQVLYLGISDTPAWVVVKANSYARAHGLTPFSVYQGQWHVGCRDMEAEIVPMCQDQGMGITTWQSLAGGQLLSAEQRKEQEKNPEARKGPQPNIELSNALEKLANAKNTTVQGIALAYLRHQSPYVYPVVGVNTVRHVEAFLDALDIILSKEDMDVIHEVSPFDPPFPMNFLYNYMGTQKYNLGMTPAHNQQYQMGAWIDTDRRSFPYQPPQH